VIVGALGAVAAGWAAVVADGVADGVGEGLGAAPAGADTRSEDARTPDTAKATTRVRRREVTS
jgi:hypothetical protein